MKSNKSPRNVVVTPPQKNLKQARLPFKLLTDAEVSPKTPSPQTKKMKLSDDTEPVKKDSPKTPQTRRNILSADPEPVLKASPKTPSSQTRSRKVSTDAEQVNNESPKTISPQTRKRKLSADSDTRSPATKLQKKLEAAAKKEEREKEKQERELKRQQEKDQKRREKEEKEEAKRKEREEKEEQRKKEKEEKEKQKEQEKKMREQKEELKRKEKEDKEEQRKKEKEAREEERRKRQEALELEKQEQELKKKKAAVAFASFFVPKQKVDKDQTVVSVSKNNMLSSFTLKADMRLAPTCRADFGSDKRTTLDSVLQEQYLSKHGLYLKSLKEGKFMPGTSGKTWPLTDKDDDDDVMIVEDELPPMYNTGEVTTCETAALEKHRPKLLSFHENRRPPYWGTWRKKSSCIKPRNPFSQDKTYLDYEVDSDEEWEEDPEGESLDGSVCGSEDEGDARDEYEVDNEVFVPHGYLSDEEATMDDDDVMSLTPETQKARLKYLEDEFETELKKPTEKLKPRMYGVLWETSDAGKPENCVDALWNYFQKFAMIMDDPTPLMQPSSEPEEAEKKKVKKKKTPTVSEDQSPKPEKKKKVKKENKEAKKPKSEPKKTVPNQPGINSFLTKIKTT